MINGSRLAFSLLHYGKEQFNLLFLCALFEFHMHRLAIIFCPQTRTLSRICSKQNFSVFFAILERYLSSIHYSKRLSNGMVNKSTDVDTTRLSDQLLPYLRLSFHFSSFKLLQFGFPPSRFKKTEKSTLRLQRYCSSLIPIGIYTG